ncbi:MFS transporter [Jiulongibacter sediminis]|uniref:MFS transporter n=1 Tax=Jiulongibacter sediminis TaxID=1605367 RepID=A0A0P7C1P0_9BACT|nr:MFS transporter [Jiulongibacter sediminis]KPM47230.1 MFS transporter [Jiulongibacter sediminis]TBX22789.1 MFS transporter [Jiulongibacter sediminis]
MSKERVFTRYQVFMIAILAFIQFTVILDFMVLSPLGAILIPEMNISTAQFGWVVSGYAFSAGVSGILAAGFADKFDRKKLLMFFYTGFLIGTAFCAMANSYWFLLMARIFTGIFGGVIGSIGYAIITDIFELKVRGRVMGFTQMAFAASQILGLPIGLYLANNFGWHSSFWMIVIVGVFAGIVMVWKMRPITAHLAESQGQKAVRHLINTVSNPDYVKVFLSTILLATGGFMLMPFGSTYSTNNLGLRLEDLPLLYGITGVFTIFFGPLLGKLADRIGKLKVFVFGSILGMILVGIYCNLGVTPFWIILALNVILFLGINARMIASSALITAVPDMKDRGAFMSINSSVSQVSGGIASAVAGMIVFQQPDGFVENYPELGWVVIASMVISAGLMFVINNLVEKRSQKNSESPVITV